MNHLNRMSGILLHPTSFPSPYGIGDLGKCAYEFIDFLEAAGQHLWQILPLTHTGFGDSPYQSFSAFAGQPLLISPDHLLDLGLLDASDITDCPVADDTHIDYGMIIPWKQRLYRLSYEKFAALIKESEENELADDYRIFCTENSFWLDDYALFMACKDENQGKSWLEWDDELRLVTDELKADLMEKLKEQAGYYKFLQFLFFTEWKALKKYANKHGVQIIGDIPIFVSMDSADVWANQHLFQLDTKGYPLAVAGVPPDYFSATGQLWGNPLYNWDSHEEEGFAWWISRIRSQLTNLDILRIDHFRGFEAYWSIPYGEETAINGQWIKAPGEKLFTAIQKALGDDLPIIAEDLGIITDEVTALRERFNFPGMKILQFAFDNTGEGDYLPHNFQSPQCVCYTGTHDNDTSCGWYQTLSPQCKKKLLRYTDTSQEEEINWSLIRLCLGSIAAYAICPLQDILSLGSEGRMNTPGVASGNWSWRYTKTSLTPELGEKLKELSILYGRCEPGGYYEC